MIYADLNSHWTACAILATPALLSGPLIACFLPDTASQELESISPESVGVGVGGATAVVGVAMDSEETIDEPAEPTRGTSYRPIRGDVEMVPA